MRSEVFLAGDEVLFTEEAVHDLPILGDNLVSSLDLLIALERLDKLSDVISQMTLISLSSCLDFF